MRNGQPPAGVILMTATISPSAAMPGVARADPALRLEDYRQAFKFYLSLPDRLVDRIIFLENSDSDLSPLEAEIAAAGSGKRVELMNVSSDSPPERNKGYAEFRMIDEGLARSRMLADEDELWKVTGRLQVENMAEMIETRPPSYHLYCDLRSVPIVGERLGGNEWMDCRLFSVTRGGYRRLFEGRYDCHTVIEKGFYRIARSELDRAGSTVVPRFRRQPIFNGHSGFSGQSYRSPGRRAKDVLRAAGRRVAPGLWI